MCCSEISVMPYGFRCFQKEEWIAEYNYIMYKLYHSSIAFFQVVKTDWVVIFKVMCR